ncbi:nucleoside-diphosphate sugar epimerase/dehydratase [Pseudoruegeria sp. SK021]|uniref:polysaccharide biosynthesis protein n=1 Tax=Pseudoruegeria sp. SK021 TaxID=1933035 RepID=UPI001F0A5A6E|nr:nucleoside-diphosphate sugar epimerase/dehydratase [Pseudoruegeria sp. SK021]
MLLTADVLVVPLTLYLALAGYENSFVLERQLLSDWETVPILMGLAGLLSYALSMPSIQLNDYEAVGLPAGAVFAVLIGLAALGLNGLADGVAPFSAFVTFSVFLFLGILAGRLTMRFLLLKLLHLQNPRTNVLIYGAGRTGMQLAAALRHDPRIMPVAFVDDNPALRRMTVVGLPVLSPAKLEQTIAEKNIRRVLLAMPSLSMPRKIRLSRRLEPYGVEVQALPSFAQLVGEEELVHKLTSVKPADLLDRSQFDAGLEHSEHLFNGKTILISGAGGSIGSELCRQVLACSPARMILLDHSELALYTINAEVESLCNSVEVVPVLGSVCDARMVQNLLGTEKVDVVLHAAAFKHVPLVEKNPLAGLANNVFGTKVLADAARASGVSRFILVSTDKAVRPINVMGASKRISEMIVQDLASRSEGTLFSMVRFGNVLGSSGSVIPLFEQQIANGGPVTLTHEDVTRYFMTIPEAARLVLISCALSRGGDVFVLDMGKPVPIRKLAHQMIQAAGYTVRDAVNPDGDIEIQVTGLRSGEKLHEELLIGEERVTTAHPKITRALEDCLSEIEIATVLRELRTAIDTNDAITAHAVLSRWIEGAMTPENVKLG